MSGSTIPQSILDVVNNTSFVDIDENPLHIKSIQPLETTRLNIYAQQIKHLLSSSHVLSVICIDQQLENKSEDENTQYFEKIVCISSTNDLSIIEMEDKITMEDLSPSELIEYTFGSNSKTSNINNTNNTNNTNNINNSEQSIVWYLAPMSKLSLESYRKTKFKYWTDMIEHPVCEAAFKRLLNIGLITKMFDHLAFPSPDCEVADWQVKDEHGKTVVIPRPVSELRIWSARNGCYESVISHLDGAPNENEAVEYWNCMLDKFRNERGTQYINDLLMSFQTK